MAASSIAKRRITKIATPEAGQIGAGDERVSRGSVSELRGIVWELEAIISGATALVEADELNMTLVENPIGAAAELLKLALLRCNQLDALIRPEAANG